MIKSKLVGKTSLLCMCFILIILFYRNFDVQEVCTFHTLNYIILEFNNN